MSERENGQVPLPRRMIRSRIAGDVWEQIKTGYAAGVGLREIARKMNIPEGTVLAHAKRHGWTQQIQVATRQLTVMQSDAILGQRKYRTKLGLSKYAAEAAERAGESDGDLALSRNVRDVAAVGSSLLPEEQARNTILNLAVLTGVNPGRPATPEKIEDQS